MAVNADILIVGGGVIGLTTAFYLAREGARVTVLDRGPLGRQASWAGAGILPPSSADHAHTPLERLRALSMRLYPELSRDLRERTGLDNGYQVTGALELDEPGAPPSDEWRSEGVAFRELQGEMLYELEPGLAPGLERGYYLPDLAQVRNPRHVKALEAACHKMGVTLLQEMPVRGLRRERSRVTAVETPEGPLAAGAFLLATGAWTDELLGQVGWRPGIHPVRGQIVLYHSKTPRPRPILLQGKRYLVPRGDGRILVGSTEEDAGFVAEITPEGVAGLRRFAVSVLPELEWVPVEKTWAGLRPASADGLPYLGRVPDWENLFVAAGHFRAGLQLSPGTGRVMTELLLGRPPAVPLEAFRLDRPVPASPASRPNR